MKNLNYSFTEKQTVDFIIDTDKEFNWVKSIDDLKYQRLFIYIDKNVEKRYGVKIKKAFAKVNKEVKYITLNANESVKSISSLTENILLLEKLGLSRFDCLVGIGGGVLIDLISFMASVYMRGVPLILIPTTLMGQVDATTAGKTCINSPSSKNLLGTLYFAKKVYINTTFISTLPKYELRQAFSEIFKYSLLNSAKLLNLLIKYKKEPLEKTLIQVIRETIKARINIRNIDPLASNLGHTFGHAFESLSNFEIGHGDAISAGLLMAIKFGEDTKITKKGTFEKTRQLMGKLGLNTQIDQKIDFKKVIRKMQTDKKSSNNSINLVLIKHYHQPFKQSAKFPFYSTQSEIIYNFLVNYKKNHPELFKKELSIFLKK